jgi:mevalonate kinase
MQFRSNGKLLLTGEYLVLKGAEALAVPLRVGQTLDVQTDTGNLLRWKSLVKGEPWFEAEFTLPDFQIRSTNQPNIANTLQQILCTASSLNRAFPLLHVGYSVEANVEFDLDWGLGSSSTLISNIAWWANCDPYLLNQLVFKGSGYDIACARNHSPLLFRLEKQAPRVKPVNFQPPFSDKLWLVWLNQKQNTRDGMATFDRSKDYSKEIERVNTLTHQLLKTIDFKVFCQKIAEHEQLLSSVLKSETVQQRLFPDFPGVMKSLGAWGGDFILVASNRLEAEVREYFTTKGYSTIFNYAELVL